MKKVLLNIVALIITCAFAISIPVALAEASYSVAENFSSVVRTEFEESHHRFDQCGVVMYLNSENWLKGSVEYENDTYQHLGSVVTNNGFSDWATTVIDATVKSMWYWFSRREDDYCIECSTDGIAFN